MGMDDATWAKHANPWSGWTRMPILPLLSLAIWSRVWLGWGALWLILAVLVWTWINPRLFGPPPNDHAWMTRAVLGERVWLASSSHPIPHHHARVSRNLNIAAVIGVIVLAYGLWHLDPGWAMAGLVITVGAKLWFLDRMVWLLADITDGSDHVGEIAP
ncbi:MAG: hypothetical protein KUG69_13445 [Marinosulfonomonas sp.]|nr:hypothetical protein [Marinosulfonomonas sp.]